MEYVKSFVQISITVITSNEVEDEVSFLDRLCLYLLGRCFCKNNLINLVLKTFAPINKLVAKFPQ
jgi:hypothetical protein